MIECPNCGGNLKFDIRSQQMACDFCNTLIDPYAVSKDEDGEEKTDYEVTIFTCPQCSGEIYSTDTTAAGFCSFCGASTILTSRLQREHKPKAIIPFMKTKEDCKTEYIKRVKKAFFAPKELRNPKCIESFRGIYMPYWVYGVSQKGPLVLLGKKSHRSGDYVITDHYNLTGDLDVEYQGISYDASTSFADNISRRIAPYDAKRMKAFTTSFLSGFYADTADVGEEIYAEDAVKEADIQTTWYLNKKMDFASYNPSYGNVTEKYHTLCGGADLAMFPVWFMSYRSKDRVAYATVNGQTGKVVADLPVKISKYILASILLTIPIFFLLNLMLTMTPAILLTVVSAIAVFALVIYKSEISEIARKESDEEDKGIQEGIRQKQEKKRKRWALEAGVTLEDALSDLIEEEPFIVTTEQLHKKKEEKKKSVLTKQQKQKTVRDRAIVASWIITMLIILSMNETSSQIMGIGFSIIFLIVAVVLSVIGQRDWKNTPFKNVCPGFIWTVLTLLVACMIAILKPVSDLIYYAGVILLLVAVLITLLDLIRKYNILATRKLPQFDYKGGDDRA